MNVYPNCGDGNPQVTMFFASSGSHNRYECSNAEEAELINALETAQSYSWKPKWMDTVYARTGRGDLLERTVELLNALERQPDEILVSGGEERYELAEKIQSEIED